jgi:translocation and assembly module TamB
MWRKGARAIAWTTFSALALLASLAAHTRTSLFLRAARDTTNSLVSEALAGEVSIGRIERLDLDRVVVRHVVIRDAAGRRVIVADRLEAVPAIAELLRGIIALDHVRLRGGTARLITEEGNAIPTLASAFFGAQPSTGPAGTPPTLRLRDLAVEDLLAYGNVPGVQNLRVEHLYARGSLSLERGALALRLRDVRGHVVSPYRPSVDLLGGYGLITNDPHRTVELHADLRSRPTTPRAPDRARARVRVFLPAGAPESAPQHVEVIVRADDVSPELISSTGVPSLGILHVPFVRGWASLTGPPDELRFLASLDSSAGHVNAQGTIRPDTDVEVNAQTESLALDELLTAGPAMRVGGRGRLTISLAPDGVTAPTFHAELEPFLFDGWAVPGLTADGAIEPLRVRLDRLDMPHAGGSVEGSGLVYFDGAMDVQARANIPQLARDPNVRRLMPGARGSLDTDLHAVVTAGPDPRVDVRGHVELGNVRAASIQARRLRVSGRMSGDPARPEVTATVSTRGFSVGGYVVGDGTATVRGGPTSYATRVRFANGDRRIEVDAAIAHRGASWQMDAQRVELAVGEAAWRGQVQGLRITPGRAVEAEMVRLASGAQRLEAHGRYGLDRVGARSFEAELQGIDVGAFSPFVPALAGYSGLVDAHITMAGDRVRPNVSVEGAVREGGAFGLQAIEAVYVLRYDVGALEIDTEVTVGDHGTFAVNVLGLIDPTRADMIEALHEGQYEARLDLARIDLDFLHEILGDRTPDLAGSATGSLAFRGSIDAPQLNGTIRFDELVYGRQPPMTAAFAATYDGALLSMNADVSVAGAPLLHADSTGNVPLHALIDGHFEPVGSLRTEPWRLHVRVPARRLDRLPAPWSEYTDTLPLSVAGELLLEGGGPEGIHADLTATGAWAGDVSALACARDSEPRFSLNATLAGGVVSATARGFIDPVDPFLEARATAPVPLDAWLAAGALPAAPPPMHLDATFPGVELGEIPYVCQTTTGALTGSLVVDQLFTDQPVARVVLDVAALRVNDSAPADAELIVNASTRAIVADLAMDYLSGDARAALQATMESSWGPSDPLPSVAPSARFLLLAELQQANLAPLLAFIPGISGAEITADGTVQAQGTRDSLTWDGALDLLDGRLQLDGPGQRLEEVEGRIVFRQNRADIQRLHARDVDGELDARGQIDFQGIVPQRGSIDVIVNDLPVRREGLVLAALSGEANLDARVAMERTEMRVTVSSLEVALPDELAQNLQELAEHPDIVVLGEERAALPDAALSYPFHIVVDAERAFWVRRSDFAAQVRAQLDVLYQSPDLRVAGYIDLRRGFFELFGKRFALQPGRMDFDGSNTLDPTLDITAVYALNAARTKTITVSVSGRLSRPQIDFSSTESSDRGEIIALLVTGRSSVTADATAQTDQNLRAADQQATSFVTGVLGGILTLGLRNEFGEFLPTISLDSTDSGTRVRAGIQVDSFIRDNLGFLSGAIEGAYVEGFVEGGAATRGGFLLELQFPYNLVGRTTYTPPINFGLDLTWEP